MGQTLSNGVYLPNEGERNCYAGLASNWQILNTAVGNIAEKAPLVHTHGNITNDGKVGTTANMPLITGTGGAVQAGSFGNQANTFCEGNDSRLSDARTPVAHTHGNITNDGKLTNGNRAVITGSDKAITESSVTDTELGYLAGVTSAIQTQLNAKAADSNVVHKTGNETISGTKTFSNSSNVDLSIQKGISSGSCNIRFNDDTGLSRTIIRSYNDKLEIGHLRNASWYDGAEFILKDDGSSKIKSNDGTTSVEVSFNPDSVKPTNSVIDLGTSSNKWKSLNGINPGALSLPDYSHPIFLDVTAQGLNWHTDTTPNFYEVPANGYFAVIVQCQNISNGVLDIFVNNTGIGSSDHGTYTGNELFCYVPVIKGQIVRVRARCDNYYSVTFYPCLGNV